MRSHNFRGGISMKSRHLAVILLYGLLAASALQGAEKDARKLSARIKANLDLAGKSNYYLDLRTGLALPVNASYVDTYENQDIYWNPNSGLSFDMKLTYKFSPSVWLSLPLETVVGYFRYTTTDGRKVNTEAQEGNTPLTTNTEWSVAPSFVPMLMLKADAKNTTPYIGIGAGIGLMWSYETWDFTNNDGNDALLYITKYYDPAIIFKGETGISIPLRKRLALNIAGTFTVANYVMKRVELSHYYIAGTDTIAAYDVVDTVYSYGFDVPDENKGGDCLLAGFAYNNYPQQKIGTNFNIKVGFTYHY